MDKPRANTATAHKLARMVYFMLTRGEAFVDQGQQRYEEQQRLPSIAALKRRVAALGFQINPVSAVGEHSRFNSVIYKLWRRRCGKWSWIGLRSTRRPA